LLKRVVLAIATSLDWI